MKNELKVRLALFGGSFAIILIVSAFLWIINDNVGLVPLLVLSGISVLVLAVFFLKGRIISHSGEIQTTMIITMIVGILLLVQFSFAFMSYEVGMSDFKFRVFNNSLETVDVIDCSAEGQYDEILQNACTEDFDFIAVCKTDGEVLYSSDFEISGDKVDMSDGDILSFVLYSGDRLVSRSSAEFEKALSKETVISQITLLITSLLFSIEFVIFVVRKMSDIGSGRVKDDDAPPAILSGVRQVAFIFYFASRLCASFIPTMAKSLQYSGPAISQNFLAGLPQTAETMFVCISVLFTSRFLAKKGWKIPFFTGLAFIFAGSFGCLVSKSLIPFVASRALVGFGYGFCWMTLRSVALLGKNDESRLMGFSLLNAGLYAGMYCGSTVGSILASKFDYGTVFTVSLCLIVLCGVNILTMANSYLPDEKKIVGEKAKLRPKDILTILIFVILMIAPSCILTSYSSYYLPLFYEDMGKGVLEVGRVQLIYGLIIVYLGPAITKFVSRRLKNSVTANCLYIGIEVVGLIIVGISGTVSATVIAMILIGIGDSFGFGVQNNHYMSLPANKLLGSGKSLMMLSLIKKLTEMLGPTAFAVAMGAGTAGVTGMGIIFAVFIGVFIITEFFGKRKGKEATI